MIEKMRVMGALQDQVEMSEIPIPLPGRGEVRIKVICSAVNPGEEKVLRGDFVGRFLHAKTSPLVLGWDFAGTVDAIGDGVIDVDIGTGVWGHLEFSWKQKQGAFAEYITIPRNELATKPDNIPYHVAAAAPTVVMTSLQSLRDLGRLRQGGKALIIGAGGGIGSVSVGIAKRLGAHVTGVCSTKDVERVRSLGADHVIDRKKSDPLDGESLYDVVFDTPAVQSFGQCFKVLKPEGAYVTTLPNLALITGMVRALFSSKRCYFVQVASKRADLELVGNWMNDGLEVPIDSRHKIADLGIALRRQNDRDRVGRVVIDVADGWPA